MKLLVWMTQLIIITEMIALAMSSDGCRSVLSISNYILYNHNYQIISNIDLLKCVIKCDTDTNCYSINYVFPMRLCELSNATRAVEAIMFEYRQDAIYIEHLYRPEGSCSGDHPCKNRGTCVNIPQFPGYRCFCTDAYIGDQCQECSSPPVGLSNNRLPNNKITGSSTGQWVLTYYYPYLARLNGPSSWVVSYLDNDMHLDINLAPKQRLITSIATQGNPDNDWWTTKYEIKYKMSSGLAWTAYDKVFKGNNDRNSVVRHILDPSFKARYVRVIPLGKNGRTAIRIELYGCFAE